MHRPDPNAGIICLGPYSSIYFDLIVPILAVRRNIAQLAGGAMACLAMHVAAELFVHIYCAATEALGQYSKKNNPRLVNALSKKGCR